MIFTVRPPDTDGHVGGSWRGEEDLSLMRCCVRVSGADTTMLERPPDPRRTNLVVPGMGMLPRSSQLGVVRSPKGSPLAAALARAGSAVGSAGGSVGGSPVGGGGSRRGQVPVWRTEAGARGGSSRGSAGLGGLGATAPPSQGSRGGGGADGGGAAIRPASGAAGAGAGSVAVGA